MSQKEREEKIGNSIASWFGCYTHITANNTRGLLISARLKTVVYRLDDKVNPFPDKTSLKLSLIAMWDKDHHKGITGCQKFGSANAMRGGFSCQLRSIPGKVVHEHNHCLGEFHGISRALKVLVCHSD